MTARGTLTASPGRATAPDGAWPAATPGAGTRVLTDQLLINAGVDPADVRGPEFRSHIEVALAIASGIADAGLAVRDAAEQLHLHFIPVAWEHYDLVLPRNALGTVEPLLSALRAPAVRAAISRLPGYDLAPASNPQRLDDHGAS